MKLPDGKAGKALAVGICVSLVASAYLAIALPLQSLHAERADDLAQLRDRLERLERAGAELPRLRVELTELRETAKKDRLLLPGSSDAVAAADLQSRIKDIVGQAGAEMTNAENLPGNPHGEFRRVGVRAVVVGDLAMMADILHTVGAARPPLFVDNIEMRNNNLTMGKMLGRSPQLNIAFDIYGFRANSPQGTTAP